MGPRRLNPAVCVTLWRDGPQLTATIGDRWTCRCDDPESEPAIAAARSRPEPPALFCVGTVPVVVTVQGCTATRLVVLECTPGEAGIELQEPEAPPPGCAPANLLMGMLSFALQMCGIHPLILARPDLAPEWLIFAHAQVGRVFDYCLYYIRAKGLAEPHEWLSAEAEAKASPSA